MALRIGLAGTGRIGRVHAENLAYRLPSAELVAVTDVNRASAEQVAGEFRVPSVCASYGEMLARADVDAVAICTSTDTHADLIIGAAEAGKHIFCEKPIALSLETIDRALAAVDRAGVKLMIGFNRRFHANFKKIHDVVASGGIGAPHLVRIASRDCAPPPVSYVKVSGGIFLDMTIHDFDMARFLAGSEVAEVFATGAVLIDPGIGEVGDVDTAVVVMWYENGAICTIDNSRQAVFGYDQRVEVLGSAGMAKCENNCPDNVTISLKDGVQSALPFWGFMDVYRESYIAEMQAFIDCVLNDTASPISGRDGRAPVVIGLAATRSLREGRRVKLSEIG